MLNFRTDPIRRSRAKARRDLLRSKRKCIAGPLVGFVSRNGTRHGRLVSADYCQRCLDTRKLHLTRRPPRHVSIREVIDAHAHLDLASARDRELLARAIRHRPTAH